MSTNTTLHEERVVIREGSAQKYQIRVDCTNAGELPDAGLFVYQIVDQADSLKDIFVRVADIVDFSTTSGFLSNRLAATIAGSSYWRSSALTKLYDDIDVADTAVKAIFDRVNTLVSDYMVYNDSFKTSGEDIDFPTTDPTQVEALKTAYNDDYASYQDAQTAQTTASDAVTAAQAKLATQQAELQYWLNIRFKFQEESGVPPATGLNDLQAMTDAYAAFNSFVSSGDGNALATIGAIDAFLFSYQGKFGPSTRKLTMQESGHVDCIPEDIDQAVSQPGTGSGGTLLAFNNVTREWWITPNTSSDTFETGSEVTVVGGVTGRGTPTASLLVGSGPIDAEVSVLRTARNSFDAARQQAVNGVAAAQSGITHHGGTSTAIGTQVTAHSGAVTQAQTDIATAQTAYNQAQGNVQTAYTALQKSYNDVKAVCPNWTPTYPFPPVPA